MLKYLCYCEHEQYRGDICYPENRWDYPVGECNKLKPVTRIFRKAYTA